MRRSMLGVAVLLAVAGSGIIWYQGEQPPGAMMYRIPGAVFRISGSTVAGDVRDPALMATGDRLRAMLQSDFPDSYTAQFEDDINHLIIVYRRPDPALDSRVRAEFPAAAVAFADARFSRTQLSAFARLILRDKDLWRRRGITVEAVANGAIGEGVDVFLAPGADPDAERLMNEHYGDIPIRVRP